MILTRSDKRKGEKPSNGRLHVVVAIVFLLMVSLIFRLYVLQVVNADYYQGVAQGQHEIYKELDPSRGRIFVRDGALGETDKIYPVAVNKDFATVFAVPKNIEEPEKVAELLFEILDKAEIELEVEKLLEEDEYFASTTEVVDEERLEEFRQIKKELEINNRKDVVVDKYLSRLNKKDDPYEPIAKKVSEEKLNRIVELDYKGIEYSMNTHRFYPDKNVGSHYIGFLGFGDKKLKGQYGLEGFFNEELRGKSGSVRSEKAADGKIVIVNDREYNAAQDGADLTLTINRSIQFEAHRRLKEAVERHEADSGDVVVMDPFTGEIIAMCSYPDYNPNDYGNVEDSNVYNNNVIFESYEPGSIFKTITMAIGVNEGKVSPSTIYNDKGYIMFDGWDKPIRNSDFETKGGHGWVDMTTVLEESLNTGSIFVMEQVGAKTFSSYVKKFGFGEKTGIELETEGYTNINNLKRNVLRPVELATASFGQGITATPLQMVTSYAVIANGGILMKPYIVGDIVFSNGEKQTTTPKQIRRVISERSALLTSGMMVNVVDGGHAKLAGVDGYYIAGKTGTAQVASREGGYGEETIHTFVGFAPMEEPKFVMLTKLNNPKDVDYSAASAAPLFGKIAKFMLDYYQVPKER